MFEDAANKSFDYHCNLCIAMIRNNLCEWFGEKIAKYHDIFLFYI